MEKENLERVSGDGGETTVTEPQLEAFKDEMEQIQRDLAQDVSTRRDKAEDVRFCRWEGQSPDGLKKAEYMEGASPFPFEGAADTRMRTADMKINERERVLVAAAKRSDVRVQGLEGRDLELGAQMNTVLKWVLRNQLGNSFRRELKKVAQWQEGDTPAAAMLGVYWKHEVALEMATITLDELIMMIVQNAQAAGKTEEEIAEEDPDMLQNPFQEDRLIALMKQIAPHIRDKRARKVIEELKATGSARFPQPYVKESVPKLTAYRLFEDVFFPQNTTDIQRARVIFVREWLSETELQEREVSQGYSPKFIKEVLKHEGESGFSTYHTPSEVSGDFSLGLVKRTVDKEAYRGCYEVITAYTRSVNEDGVPGIYYTCFSHAVEFAAKKRALLDYAHGKYPFVFFAREVLTSRLWDSRSVSELAMTHQQMQKFLWDSFCDHTTLSTVPPVRVPKSRPRVQLTIGPMSQVKESRPGEIQWMEPPRYPSTNDKAQAECQRQIDQYFCRTAETVPPAMSALASQDMVDSFLGNLKDALVMMMQLVQQYMPDETIQRVTGSMKGVPVARSRKDIQGKFDLELTFDARDLDLEYVLKKAEVIGKYVLPIDVLSTVQRDKLVARLFAGIDPALAEDTLQPVQSANRQEIEDEQVNFAKIAAGVEPPMLEAGQNHQLRLQVLQSIGESNPQAMERLQEDSQQILETRLKHLGFMVQQQTNAKTGRVGAQPALGKNGTARG